MTTKRMPIDIDNFIKLLKTISATLIKTVLIKEFFVLIYIKNNIPKGTTVILNYKILTQILANIIILIYLSNSESNSRISILANCIKKVDTNTIAITFIEHQDGESSTLEDPRKYIGYSKSERLTICANLARNIDGKLLTAKVKGRGRAYILLLDV